MFSLLIDTHDQDVCFILYKDGKVISNKIVKSKFKHSEIAMPSLIELLSENHINVNDIHDIICVVGPGSFTGVRIGVVIAKTLALILNIPIRPITSLDLLAFSVESVDECTYAVSEKNGYFIAKYNNGVNADIKYISKSDYEEYKLNHKVNDNIDLNYDLIYFNSKKLETVNPHLVNPLYIKNVEGLK